MLDFTAQSSGSFRTSGSVGLAFCFSEFRNSNSVQRKSVQDYERVSGSVKINDDHILAWLWRHYGDKHRIHRKFLVGVGRGVVSRASKSFDSASMFRLAHLTLFAQWWFSFLHLQSMEFVQKAQHNAQAEQRWSTSIRCRLSPSMEGSPQFLTDEQCNQNGLSDPRIPDSGCPAS